MAAPTQHQETGVVDLGALLDAGEGSIVTLVSGETRLAVHRAVLSATSPVFAAMFRHDTLEANTGEVAVPDVEGPVLRQLVAYMYTGRTPQLPGMAHLLLEAADKYNMDVLKASCEQQVVAQLDLENAAEAAVLSVRHSCPTLREAAVNFVRGHTHEVMTTQGWANSVRRQPEDVIEFSRLLAEAPPETSAATVAPAAAATPTTPAATTQPTARRQTPPPDDAAVSRFPSLSEAEKGRRLRDAAEKGAVEEVRALLAAGADVGAGDKFRQTALHEAAAGGHAAAVRLLLAASADPNARDENGSTPLHFAACYGHTEAASALLEGGVDWGARDNDGNTALDDARQRNHQQVVDLLTR